MDRTVYIHYHSALKGWPHGARCWCGPPPMNTVRFAFALAALLLWAPAWSQTAEPQRSSLPSRELPPAELLAELRKGGYVLYFRHAATDFSQNDERMKNYEDCADQRNLIDRKSTRLNSSH